MNVLHGFVTALGWTTFTLSQFGVLYMLLAALATLGLMHKRRPSAATSPNVTIIKPLHGANAALRETLERFCRQAYSGQIQIIFGVHTGADPAVSVVKALQSDHPELDIDLVIDARLHGKNRKASNLINIAARAKHEVLILSDADIIVEPNYVETVVASLCQSGVGAVSCLYVGQGDQSLWSRLSAMAINYQFLPGAALGRALGMAEPCFGSTIGIRAEVLGRIGGFNAIADHLADDYEIGRAVRGLGLRIAFPSMVVQHVCNESSGPELVDHELRWGRTVRQIDPVGYLGSLITFPLPLAIIAAACLGWSPMALALVFVMLGVRIGFKFCIDQATGTRAGQWWLIGLRDVLSFAVFLASFAVNTVGWQGQRFRVSRDGVLIHT